MTDDLLAQLKLDRAKALQEVEKLDHFIAQMQGGDEGDGKLVVPLAPFLQEDNLDWEWLFGGLIPTGSTCILAGEGKIAGKSTLIIQMSLCLAAGRSPFYECPVSRAAPVLYIAAEGARAALQNRIRTAARSLGMSPSDTRDFWHIQKKNVSDYRFGSAGLERMIDQSGAKLVVADTLGYFHKGNENDNTDFKAHVMHPLRQLTAKYGCAFVLVDHQSKPSPERKGVHKVRGASAKKDDCDVVMQLEPPPGEEMSDKRTLWLSATKYSATRRWDLRFDMAGARFS